MRRRWQRAGFLFFYSSILSTLNSSAHGSKVYTVPGAERQSISNWVQTGRAPFTLRCASLHDRYLVRAIVSSPRQHRIQILICRRSPEINALLKLKNVEVRINPLGRFENSIIAEIRREGIMYWVGPRDLVLRRAPKTTEYFVDGSALGEIERFAREFRLAKKL